MPDKTCDTDNLSAGDKLYEMSYYTVQSVDQKYVTVRNMYSQDEVCISRSLAEQTIYSTEQHTEQQKVTRTQLAQKIETLGHAAFRVTFRKQVTANDVADQLENEELDTRAKRRKVMKRLMEGPLRSMNARLFRTDEFDVSMELGRYRVIDLDALAEDTGVGLQESTTCPGQRVPDRCLRLVDTRTVTELVVDNVRYYVA